MHALHCRITTGWVPDFEAVLSMIPGRKNTQGDLSSTTCLSPAVINTPPTMEDLRKIIDSLACGKAPGSDRILPEVIKAGRESSLLGHLHKIPRTCATSRLSCSTKPNWPFHPPTQDWMTPHPPSLDPFQIKSRLK